MNGQWGGGFRVSGGETVVVAGGTAADRNKLRRCLDAAGLEIPIETVADVADSERAGSGQVGVVRLSVPGEEVPRIGEDGSDLQNDASLIVVGPDIDVAAAYEAGAVQAVPLAVSDLPDAVIDRMVACLRRGRGGSVPAELLDAAPVGVTLHSPETGELLACNGRCEDLLGFDASAGEADLSAVAVGGVERSEVVTAVRRAAEGTETTVELAEIGDRAEADRLEVRFEPVTAGDDRFVVGWVRDVTNRAERDREVERYETILESIGDAVYATDVDGTVEYVNQKYVSMKGVDRETVLGTNIYDWVSDETEAEAKALRRKLRAGEREVGKLEYEFESVDGDRTPAELRFAEITNGGESVGRVGVIRDISDQKSYEQRLERQNERLEEFASVVSHDLRNPLSVASGRLELAMEECDSSHLGTVADAHDRMSELIDDLLTLARQGDDIREVESVDLASLVETCWENVETGAATIEAGIDRPIRADPGRLRQLVGNLIRNSVEHAGDDVTVRVGALDDGAGFYVADDGPGIPPDQREAVFEAGHSSDPEGTGFGLRIVNQIAEAHGWTVSLTDASGGGARFEFSGVTFAAE
jgi:PAS domain S-box-containing protein